MRQGNLPDQGRASSKLTPEMKAYFSQPAKICQVCGDKMEFDEKWWKWERKWSIHRSCYDEKMGELDRMTGVSAQRMQKREQIERKREEMRRIYGK